MLDHMILEDEQTFAHGQHEKEVEKNVERDALLDTNQYESAEAMVTGHEESDTNQEIKYQQKICDSSIYL